MVTMSQVLLLPKTSSARIMIAPLLLRLLFFSTITVIVSSTTVFASSVSSSDPIRHQNDDADDQTTDTVRKLYDTQGGRGLQRCLQDKIFSERVEIGTKCLCKDQTDNKFRDEDKGIVLVCSDQCAFCNDKRTVCGIKSEEALYDVDTGSKTAIGQVFEYLRFGPITDALSEEQQATARDGGIILGIEEVDCNEEDVDSTYVMGRCSRCNVYFGGTKCNFCEVSECGKTGSGIFAPVMDCSNIQPGAVFDFCADNIDVDESNLFQAFDPDQFRQCLPMENLLEE